MFCFDFPWRATTIVWIREKYLIATLVFVTVSTSTVSSRFLCLPNETLIPLIRIEGNGDRYNKFICAPRLYTDIRANLSRGTISHANVVCGFPPFFLLVPFRSARVFLLLFRHPLTLPRTTPASDRIFNSQGYAQSPRDGKLNYCATINF